MKTLIVIASIATTMLATAVPAQAAGASASRTCSLGNSGVTYNQLGDPAKFTNLSPFRGMNCASARYVMNKWLRRAYSRTYSTRLPRRFYDGYVTWHCYKRTSLRWQCDEYDSYTSFRFTAYRF